LDLAGPGQGTLLSKEGVLEIKYKAKRLKGKKVKQIELNL